MNLCWAKLTFQHCWTKVFFLNITGNYLAVDNFPMFV